MCVDPLSLVVMPKKKWFVVIGGSLFIAFGILFQQADLVAAQLPGGLGVAHPYLILGENIQNGTVVAHRDNQYLPSAEPYDKNMFGVVAINAALEFVSEEASISADLPPNTYPVISSGVTEVRVSARNGRISKGDPITSSDIPGVAMRADKSGFVLGFAQASFNPESLDQTGLLLVALDPKFSFADEDSPESEQISDRLRDVVNISAIAALQEPDKVFRYVIAAIIMLGSFAISFLTFIRTAQKGIDALGRNPLARGSISISIFINVLISFAIILSGVAGAYFITIL